jgi:hypothetical protein
MLFLVKGKCTGLVPARTRLREVLRISRDESRKSKVAQFGGSLRVVQIATGGHNAENRPAWVLSNGDETATSTHDPDPGAEAWAVLGCGRLCLLLDFGLLLCFKGVGHLCQSIGELLPLVRILWTGDLGWSRT